LKLHYDAADVFPEGRVSEIDSARGAERVRVDYGVALKGAVAGKSSAQDQAQSFVAVNSFSSASGPGRETKFCWPVDGSEDIAAASSEQAKGGGWHCEDFKPAGEVIELPAGTKRVDALRGTRR
jgi:hypothetical protein